MQLQIIHKCVHNNIIVLTEYIVINPNYPNPSYMTVILYSVQQRIILNNKIIKNIS